MFGAHSSEERIFQREDQAMGNGTFGPMHDFNGTFGFGHDLVGFHGLLWLALLIVIGFALYALLRDRRRERVENGAHSALALRYARGDVDRDTYLAMKKDLESGRD
jgi:putative membrane protein